MKISVEVVTASDILFFKSSIFMCFGLPCQNCVATSPSHLQLSEEPELGCRATQETVVSVGNSERRPFPATASASHPSEPGWVAAHPVVGTGKCL